MTDIIAMVETALRHRFANGGRHLHHSSCIHNLDPEEQIEIRRHRFTREQYIEIVGMPTQITPEDWECDSPFSPPSGSQTEGADT